MRVGIRNYGNTCYLNAILQCLAVSPAFVTWLSAAPEKSTSRILGKVLSSICNTALRVVPDAEMKLLIAALSQDMKGVVNVFEQNDAHEFFVVLLDRLSIEVGKPMPILPCNRHPYISHTHDIISKQCDKAWATTFSSEFSFINTTFFGQTVQQVKCGGCGKCHHNYDVFSVLEVPVCDSPTLDASIAAAFANEVVNSVDDANNNNKWICDTCNKSYPSNKITQLWKTPETLVICAKRFSYDENFRLTKDCRPINFPASLDLEQHSIGYSAKNKYSLAGIVNHLGHMGRGHYTAIAFPPATDMCFHIDDDIVSHNTREPDKYAAYMAFYVAKTNTPQ
jgi:ubiquitin C-terminal hydrolase